MVYGLRTPRVHCTRWVLPALILLFAVFTVGPKEARGESEGDRAEIVWKGEEVLPDRAERNRWRLKLAGMIERADFWELEGELAEAEATQRWTLEGLPAASVFHNDIADYLESQRRQFEEENIRFLEAWRKEYPGSPAPRALLARMYWARAWYGEERNELPEGSEERRKVFRDLVQRGNEVMQDAYMDGIRWDQPSNIEGARIALELGRDFGAPGDMMGKMLQPAARLNPDYFPLYRGYMLYLYPEWYGSYERYAGFCDAMYEWRGGVEGQILYARLAGYAINHPHPAEFYRKTPLDFERVHQGYRKAFAQYPLSRQLASEYYRISRLTGNDAGQDWIFGEVGRRAGVNLEERDRWGMWRRLDRDVDAVLIEAARTGDGPLVVVMLRLGGDPFRVNETGLTARSAAFRAGHKETERLLVRAESELRYPVDRDINDLLQAVHANRLDLVNGFIAEGAEVNAGEGKENALFQAVYEKDYGILQALLEAGGNPDTVHENWSLLKNAAYWGKIDHLAVLLDHGADIDLRVGKGSTALHVAAEQNKLDALELLLDRGADMASRYEFDSYLWTPLAQAVYSGNPEAAGLLIARGADVHETLGRGTYLALSVIGKNVDTVRLLVEQGVDPNVGEIANGVTPLQLAAQYGAEEVLNYFVRELGLDVNRSNAEGSTALHIAAYRGRIRAIEILLENGGDPTIRNSFGATPYEVAQFKRQMKAAELLAQATEPLIQLPLEARAGYPESGREE